MPHLHPADTVQKGFLLQLVFKQAPGQFIRIHGAQRQTVLTIIHADICGIIDHLNDLCKDPLSLCIQFPSQALREDLQHVRACDLCVLFSHIITRMLLRNEPAACIADGR